MRIFISIILTLLSWFVASFPGYGQDKMSYVNPFIGTAPTKQPSQWDGHGRTYPGAVAPFGYIQLTPETRISSGKGYDYRDSSIYFFSCMRHFSGYPNGSAGQGKIMPVENNLTFQLKRDSRPFSHQHEKAEPGYYKVVFDDNRTEVEAAASVRAGMFRFTYAGGVKPKIFVGDIGKVELGPGAVIKGSKRHAFVEFNHPWQCAEQLDDGLLLVFDPPDDNTLLLKIGTSSVSFQNAKRNIDADIPKWDFDRLKQETLNRWEEELSVIEISDSSEDNKVKFYTALYHSLLLPWIISDTDGTYRGYDRKVHKSKRTAHYGAFSPWDTFRSLHPLLCIIAPERQNDMIVSLLEIYAQTGQLPVQPMTGYHSIPIIVDSWFKNIRGFNASLAYEAMKACLIIEPYYYPDMYAYVSKGFVPSTYPESVTRTVEYAYNDWVLSRFAEYAMHQSDDHSMLLERSLSYRNLFDPNQLFLVPRGREGFHLSTNNFGYKEGDKWNYSFFVPHNPRDLINLKGGPKAFTNHLDSAIRNHHILFDNEPNFHIPWLFNYSGTPAKTQEWVSKIRDVQFDSTPGGLPGNDDLGSMSSWFVFNALGFYPVSPGMPEYNIGTPLFREAVIHLKNGRKFVIKGLEASRENKYIREATLNDTALNRSWFSHTELTDGGELDFHMDSLPSQWASQPEAAAFSVTKSLSDIFIDHAFVEKKEVESNDLFWVKFHLSNRGANGVKELQLMVDGNAEAHTNVFVKEGESVVDSVACRLYKPGITQITMEGYPRKMTLNISDSGLRQVVYSKLSLQTLLNTGERQKVSFWAKNIGGGRDTSIVRLMLNDVLNQQDTIILEPGETAPLKYTVSGFEAGINTLGVDDLSALFKVVDDPHTASLVDFSFQNQKDGKLPDRSGFLNHGIIKSPNPQAFIEKGFDASSYVEINNAPSFSALEDEITLMGWFFAKAADKYPVSLITQGDYNVLQLTSQRDIEFFSGGWGRGACNVRLPFGIIGGWHHMAGVCNGLVLKLYIDGELHATSALNNRASLAHQENWNLGRNEEFPGERIFYGKMDEVKILAVALSQEEIGETIEAEKNELLREK